MTFINPFLPLTGTIELDAKIHKSYESAVIWSLHPLFIHNRCYFRIFLDFGRYGYDSLTSLSKGTATLRLILSDRTGLYYLAKYRYKNCIINSFPYWTLSENDVILADISESLTQLSPPAAASREMLRMSETKAGKYCSCTSL